MAFVVIFIAANAQTPDQIAAESKRAGEFFDKCWDETLARHPVDESFYGIKTHYDQLEDLSDEKADGRPRSLAKTACGAEARLQTRAARSTSAIEL